MLARSMKQLSSLGRNHSSSKLNNKFILNLRSLFIQVETTPNPESLKFLPGKPVLTPDKNGEVLSGFYVTYNEKTEIARSPLAKELFNIDGVKGVYLGEDFITVTKFAESHWMHVRSEVFTAVMDFYSSGKTALLDAPEVTDTTIFDDDDEVVAMIKEILEARIRPAVQEDGGDIHYAGFDEESGIVSVKLAGSCVGCPSSTATLKNGVENMLMHYVPEVQGVVALDQEEHSEDQAIDPLLTEEFEDDNSTEEKKKLKTYEERLAAAGIPHSD